MKLKVNETIGIKKNGRIFSTKTVGYSTNEGANEDINKILILIIYIGDFLVLKLLITFNITFRNPLLLYYFFNDLAFILRNADGIYAGRKTADIY